MLAIVTAMASCGDSGSSGDAASAGGTWAAYMNVREGRVCKATVEQNGVTARASSVVADVERRHRTLKFVLLTKIIIGNTPAITLRVPYELLPDGTARSTASFPSVPGFDMKVKGAVRTPSVEQLRAGKTETSAITMTMTPSNDVVRRTFGAEPLIIHALTRTGPAPLKTQITTPKGTYSDLVGTRTTTSGVRFEHADGPTRGPIVKALTKTLEATDTRVYYARGVGDVQTIQPQLPAVTKVCTDHA